MLSFYQLLEVLENSKTNSEIVDNNSIRAIKNGISIRDTFWEDFLNVINSSEAMSELLDVPVHKISTWREKIIFNLEKVKEQNKEIEVNDNKKLIKTGLPEL